MALYTKESKDRVRDAVDFVELVSARTELRRAGPTRYEGLCPFHDERSPSFGIDPAQKVYYCFGCQSKGDLFTFVQETEGVDFKGALELLAERYGIELQREEEDPQEAESRRKRERLHELLARTAAYYERVLWESAEGLKAREYLLGRGLSEEILRAFRVGYAPSAWDKVLLASRRGGYSEQELYATGLAQRSRENGRPYDRFRSRITFPLADIRGRVLGFGARAMEGDDGPAEASGRRPKYLNTSDTDVYHKGQHLYGGDLARPHAAKAGQVILCEGYTDVIALHQAGMRNAVGLMGTALTGDQVGEMARMSHTVLMALDADTAGQKAMLRAYGMANQRKLTFRVVAMPPGQDPAEVLQKGGPGAMQSAIDGALEFARFQVERVLDSGNSSDPEVQERMLEELRPIFQELPVRSATRLELTQMVSSRLAMGSSDLVEQRLAESAAPAGPARSGSPGRQGRAAPRPAPRAGQSRRGDTERAFLALCIAAPVEGASALAGVDVEEDFSSDLLRRAAKHLRAGDLSAPMAPAAGDQPAIEDDQPLQALLAELIVEAGRDRPNPGMLEVQRLQLELARLERGIQRARGREDADVSGLAHEKAQLKVQFDRAYSKVLEQTGERD